MPIKLKARVGSQRITRSLDPTEASYTRSIREQMKAIEDAVEQVFGNIKRVTPDILRAVLQPTFEKSQVYVPVDTGDLKASGRLDVTQKGETIQAEISYGKGSNPHYAAYVHEMTTIAHAEPTRSKYLQAAIEEDLNLIPKRLRKAYKEAAGV